MRYSGSLTSIAGHSEIPSLAWTDALSPALTKSSAWQFRFPPAPRRFQRMYPAHREAAKVARKSQRAGFSLGMAPLEMPLQGRRREISGQYAATARSGRHPSSTQRRNTGCAGQLYAPTSLPPPACLNQHCGQNRRGRPPPDAPLCAALRVMWRRHSVALFCRRDAAHMGYHMVHGSTRSTCSTRRRSCRTPR
jgi:hypothetical protein